MTTFQSDELTEAALRRLPELHAQAWNSGSGQAYGEPFAEDGDCILFSGLHLKGRDRIASLHEEVLTGFHNGTKLSVSVNFARMLTEDLGIVHANVSSFMPGQSVPSPGRESMQLFVASRNREDWTIEVLQNARRIAPERQELSDLLDGLSHDGHARVLEFIGKVLDEEATGPGR